ncbi:MAG: hypothetical protein JG781_2080 [Peptococcaceae bacterium]|jgi:glycosyltransferase involved in cell wall biosynthesis|nr:hypothetical protein [Peptococcaceae bacterium]
METRISLCIIAKNEAENLRRCLTSVAGAVDEIIVVDTGSTDNTCEIAREFGAKVYTFLWNGSFADARNVSLDQATGDWILYLDCDEELAAGCAEILRRLTSIDDVEGYLVKIINYLGNEGWVETCPDLVFRLFRNRPEYRFRGAIHEQIADVILEKNSKASYRLAEDLVILHYGYLDKQIKEKDKKNRNLNLIEKELQERPQDFLLRYHYGVELFRAERYTEAAFQLTQAANNLDPNTVYFPKLIRYIVLAHQSALEPEKALQAALLGLKLFPNYADLYYYAGLLYLDLKKYKLAQEYLLKAASMPEQPAQYASFGGVRGFRAYYHLAKIAETFLDYEESLKFYITSLRDNPYFKPALERIVQILNPRLNPEYSKVSLEKVFDFSNARAILVMGEIYFHQGAYGLALDYLLRAERMEPLSPETLLWKAICLAQERRYLEALRILDTYTPESHLYPLAKFNKLICFWLQNSKRKVLSLAAELSALGLAEDTQKVVNLFTNTNLSAITLGSDGMALLLDIVKRLLALKETEKAQHFLKCLNPSIRTLHSKSIAQLFYDYGYEEEAALYLKEYLTIRQDGEAHFLLAEIYHERGKFLEAEEHYRYAQEIDPDQPRYYLRLIQLYEKKRRMILEEALLKYPEVDVFEKLLEEAPVT